MSQDIHPPIERRSYPRSNEYLPLESDSSPSEFLGSYHSSLRPSPNSTSTVNASFSYEQFTSPDIPNSPNTRNLVSRTIRTSTYPQSSTPLPTTTSALSRPPQRPIGTQPEFSLVPPTTLFDSISTNPLPHTSQSPHYYLRTPLRVSTEYINTTFAPESATSTRLVLPEPYRNNRHSQAIYNILHHLPVSDRSREKQRLDSPYLKLNLYTHPVQTNPPNVKWSTNPFPFFVTKIDFSQPPHPKTGKQKESRTMIHNIL